MSKLRGLGWPTVTRWWRGGDDVAKGSGVASTAEGVLNRLGLRRTARATRLTYAAGIDSGASDAFEQLESRQLLFTLTVTPDLVDPATGLGRVVRPFAYVIPRFNVVIPDPVADDTLLEDFNDETAPWTTAVPAAPPNGTTFAQSNIVLTYRGPTPTPVIADVIGGATPNRRLRIGLNTSDQVQFSLFNSGTQGGPRVPRQANNLSFTINFGADGNGINTTAAGTRLELLRAGLVVGTFQGNALANLITPIVGGERFNVSFPAGFDSFRFASAQNAPNNATYADSFIIDNIGVVFPSSRFAQVVDSGVFGAVISFTGPVGSSVTVRDVYGRDAQATLRARIPQGATLPEIDANGDGIPDYNDGIGSITINGGDSRSSFTIAGGAIVAIQDGDPAANPWDIYGFGDGWKIQLANSPAGITDAFQQARLGFTTSASGDQVIGLPQAGGSVVVGSPFVRNNTGTGLLYYGNNGTPNAAAFGNPNQGIFINGSIGSIRSDALNFGSITVNGAVGRISLGTLYGTVNVSGDVGDLYITGDAGIWVNPEDAQAPNANLGNLFRPTGARISIGRTIRQLVIGGRSAADVSVLADVNNSNRAVLNQSTYFSNEIIFGRNQSGQADSPRRTSYSAIFNDGDYQRRNPGAISGNGDGFFGVFPAFSAGGQPVAVGTSWLRNDSLSNAEFVGYNGTSVRVFGSLSGTDPINSAFDATDVYAFPVEGGREVVISSLDGVFPPSAYVRVVDRLGRTVAGTESTRRGGNTLNSRQVIRFTPDAADVYYLVLNDSRESGDPSPNYGIEISGMAAVTFGQFRTARSAGASVERSYSPVGFGAPGEFTLTLSSGSLGQIAVGTSAHTGSLTLINAEGLNNSQGAETLFSLGTSQFNIARNLYAVNVGSDIRNTLITTGGNIGVITTGLGGSRGPSSADAPRPLNIGDFFGELRIGGTLGALDISGTMAVDQVNDVSGTLQSNLDATIQTGRTQGLRGDIGQVLVGAWVFGATTTIITSPGSQFDQFLVGTNNDGAGSFFPGQIRNSQPTIRMGQGSDLRFADFGVIQRTTPGDADVVTRINFGSFFDFTDDAGATVRISFSGGDPAVGGVPSPAAQSFAIVRVLPIDGSQGVAIARIDATLRGNADLTITTLTPGVVSIGRINIDAANGTQSPATPTDGSAVLISGPGEVDILRIDQTAGTLRSISNTTIGGDLVGIDALALKTLTIAAGDLGRTQTSTAGPNSLGRFLGIRNKTGGGATGNPLGVSNAAFGGTGGGWTGTGTYLPITLPPGFMGGWGLADGRLEDAGSPIDPFLNGVTVRTGDLRNVTVSGSVGDIIVEVGDLLTVTANSDNLQVSGAFDGIVGSIYATNINQVNIGAGLATPGPGPFAIAGIFADGNINIVTGTNARIEGLIGAAAQFGPSASFGTDTGFTPIPVVPAFAGINQVTLTNGRYDNAYIYSLTLDDFWGSERIVDQAQFRARVNQTLGTNTDLFRSFVEGFRVETITLTRGAFDASIVNAPSIGIISADQFRNTTRLGERAEFRPSLISSSTDLQSLVVNNSAVGDITDLTLDIGGSVLGPISARTINRLNLDVNNTISSVTATVDIISLGITAGQLNTLSAGRNIRATTISTSGPIASITAGGEATKLLIDSAGPDGRLDLLRANGLIQGTITSSGGIGTIESTTGDVNANITTRQDLGRTIVPGLNTLRAGRDYLGSLSVIGDVRTIVVGRNIGAFGVVNPSLDLRRNVGNITTGTAGQIYSDVLVGQSVTGEISIGRVNMLPGSDLVSTTGINVFGTIASIRIAGDYAGAIVSRSGGINLIQLTDGSLRPSASITVRDGNLGTLRLVGGDLLANVTVDGNIDSIDVRNGSDGFKGQIGVASFRRNSTLWKTDIRNQLPPGVQRTSGSDGVLIRSGGTISSISVEQGSIWESRIVAAQSINSVVVGLQFRNDAITTGNLNQIVAGERIGTVTINAFVGGLGIVAGVTDLGQDLSLGGTGANLDQVRSGSIGSVNFNGRSVVNSYVSAGIAPDSFGFYNTPTSRAAGGESAIGSVNALRNINVSAFASGSLGATSPGVVRGGDDLLPSDNALVVNAGPFGQVISQAAPFNYTTSAGLSGTITFSGPGQAYWNAALGRIRLVNTTLASTLRVERLVNGAPASIGNIAILGNTGAALGSLTINGILRNTTSNIYIDGDVNALIITGEIQSTAIIGSGGSIGTLTLANVVSGNFRADAVASLAINGNFGGSFLARSISSLTVSGSVSGAISSDRTINSVTLGSLTNGGVRSGDRIESFSAGSVTTGRVSARGGIGTINVTGDVSLASFLAGADLGTDADFGGAGTAADTLTNGNIGSVNVGGNFRRSDLGAGVLRGPSNYLGNTDTRSASGLSTIGTVTLTGAEVGSLANSEQFRILSTGTVGAVTVAGQPFTSRGNFSVQTVAAVAIPVLITDLVVVEDSRIYTAVITFNQQVDQSTLSSALAVTELRSGGTQTIALAEGTDYTVRYDQARNQARVTFNRAVTARALPQQVGLPGPGVYQFRLSSAALRGSTQDTILDGNADGTAGDNWTRNTIVGDAGDKTVAGNPSSAPQINFYAPADLDLVLRTNTAVGSLPQTNTTFKLSGVLGDHPNTDPVIFRAGGDVDVYRISLRAGQILRMGELGGAAQQAIRAVFDSSGAIVGSSNFGAEGATGGLRKLPNNVNNLLTVTPEDQFLVLTTGTYFITISASGNAVVGGLTDVNVIENTDAVPGAAGAYNFDIMVFDDQDSGFNGDTASSIGAAVVYAPSPSALPNENSTFVIGDWTFRRVAENLPSSGVTRTIISGTNSQGWTSIRRPVGTNLNFDPATDVLSVNVNSAIGLANSSGQPGEVASDVDVYRLNNGQSIPVGSRVRATLRLTNTGSNIGLAPEQIGRDVRGLATITAQNLLPTVQFALFETPAGTTFDNAILVAAPSDVLPIGGQARRNVASDGRTTYGYDANGDFFMDFVIPAAQGAGANVAGSFALYIQGSLRSDYRLEIVQQAPARITTPVTRQDILLESLGGTIGWLEAGNGVTTRLDAFDVSTAGFTGQVDGLPVGEYVLNRVVSNLNTLFVNLGLDVNIATTAANFQRGNFSTVYLAGNTEPTAFFNNATFGASQRVDAFNADKNDQAVVFLSQINSLGYDPSRVGVDLYAQSLTAAVARRIGELLGVSLETGVTAFSAAVPVQAYNSVFVTPTGGTGIYTFSNTVRGLARLTDNTTTNSFFIGSQNAATALTRLIAPR